MVNHRTLGALVLIALVLASAQAAWADEIRLDGGDHLTGTVKRIEAGQAVIETSYAGEITVSSDAIVALSTEELVTVIFNDGDYITGRIQPGPGKALRLVGARSGATVTFGLDDVQGVYRGNPRAIVREATSVKLTGAINGGVLITNGNTDTASYHLDLQLRAATPKNRYSLYAEFNREKTDGEVTADNWLGSLQYDYFFSDRLYLFNSATFASDEFADLDLRTALSTGLGYQVFDTADRFLYGELGVAYISVNHEEAEDEDSVGARYALQYEQALLDGVRFFHFQEGLIGGPADFYLRTRTGFRFMLTQNFQATTEVDVNYVASPPPGVTSTDTAYILTLGYTY